MISSSSLSISKRTTRNEPKGYCYEITVRMSSTSPVLRFPTKSLQDAVQGNPALLSFPGRMPLTGGVPLIHAGHVVGAVGSSGGTPEEDSAVCAAAVAAMAGRG